MKPTPEQIEAGQAVYDKKTLAIYDILVLGISNRLIWKCPTNKLKDFYNENLSANHLDVGVGTGYFLDRCRFPENSPRLALMDLNAQTLAYTSQRVARYNPESYRVNVLEPIRLKLKKFDSIGINYLLHCLPGDMQSKAVTFDYLKEHMNSNAVLFGSTLLHEGVSRNWAAKRLMNIYNKKGIFTNTKDSAVALEKELKNRFSNVKIKITGCAALFSAR